MVDEIVALGGQKEMSFDKYGFLGHQIENTVNEIYSENKYLFDLIYEINEFAQSLRTRINVHQENVQELLSASLFIKVVHSAQSVIILARLGLGADAKSVLRIAIEALSILKLSCEDGKFVEEFVKSDKAKQLKQMNIISENSHKVYDGELKAFVTEEKKAGLKKEVDSENIKELKAEQLAVRAGLKAFYELAYRVLSDEVHTSPRSLDKYFDVNEKGDIISLNFGPQYNDIHHISTTVSVLLVALESISKLFNLKIGEKLTEFQKRQFSSYTGLSDNIT